MSRLIFIIPSIYLIKKNFLFCLQIELYGHNQLPKICFTVVKKRHNTRFFSYDKQSNQTNNIQPGNKIIFLKKNFVF
jgi:hypothetical protein